jgi:hypothetical protein
MHVLRTVAAVALLIVPVTAQAQISAADKAAADALFKEGKELLDAGRAAEACGKLAESQRIDARLGTLLNLATCHETVGKTASAWAAYNEAAAQAAATRQGEREKFARGKLAELEAKLSKLTLVVAEPPPGLVVNLDGSELRAAALGTAIPVDPGPHVIEARAPGHVPWSAKVDAAPGPAERRVDVPKLTSDAPPPPAAPPPASAPVPSPAPSKVRSAAGLGAFAAGSAVLGAGVFFGLRTFALRDDAERDCVGDRCTQAGLDRYDDARTSATISTIAIPVGVLLMAAGAYFVLFQPSADRSALAISPMGARGTW